jgi:hypothetical protein
MTRWVVGLGILLVVVLMFPVLVRLMTVDDSVLFTESPLHQAAVAGHMQGVREALESVPDINARDEFGKTALHYTAENGFLRNISALLEHGADANILDNQGFTALELARANGHEGTAGALVAATTIDSKDLKGQRVNPSLKYPDVASFERAIGQPAALLKDDHVWLFAPKNLEKEAKIVHPYLVKAYDALYDIVGVHTEYIIVVYHFPKGHADAFGGTSNCTIWYDDTNLKLNQHEEWTKHKVPHVSGYIEEMGHNFGYTQFGWEIVGWSIGMKATQKVADNPVFRRSLDGTRRRQEETFAQYRALDNTFPKDIEPNKVDRIHGYLLWQCEQQYGPDFWQDFFKEAKKEKARLSVDNRDERYRITVECFDRLPGLGFKRRLRTSGISRTVDVKSMNPEKPGWNRKLE